MNPEKSGRLEKNGILLLKREDQNRKIEFELKYLSSLTLQDRFALMLAKSNEMIINLANNGHRKTPSITKRK